MRWQLLALTFLLASCGAPAIIDSNGVGTDSTPATASQPPPSIDDFTVIVRAVLPVATRECRRRATAGTNCNFQVVVDPRRRAAPNAYQSVDDQGRPVLTFTASLISGVRSPDELAFILAHEAAHHIAGHLLQKQQNAASGAEVFADLATLTGGSAADADRAQELGAAVGARSYSKEFELEADQLGSVIAFRAGYDPLLGAQFLTRIPDPGDRFLASHPPNAARLDMVRNTVADLGGS